uniref:Brl1/Brr6 domain-containing protein n=1 Tax=Melanopsichium pennsylvanicum 4 TaxID=1398559 RepID=A0A077R0E6_9BASI|nr:conserved hypothetical protein [Melanopsichium pennsylvanicum 4]
MLWQRGTEAPMDTSLPGPPQRTYFARNTPAPDSLREVLTPLATLTAFLCSTREIASIFDTDRPQGWSTPPTTSQMPIDTDMTDVEMSSLTPPSHRAENLHARISNQNEELADDLMENADNLPRNISSKVALTESAAAPSQHVRRKRSVLSRKGKRLAHLQSREFRSASRESNTNDGDDKSEGNYDTDDNEEEDEEDDPRDTPSRIRSITKYAVNYILPNVISTIPHQPVTATHSAGNPMDKPELLLGYAQLIFNASILSTFLYLLYHIVRTVQRDVAEKVRAYEMDTLAEITACTAAYTANRCGTDLQAPALASACKNWERCSARDPAVVGTARVTAETFAEILNGFVDSVSWKTMLFTLICFSIVVGATNSFLSFFRIKSQSHTQGSNQGLRPTQHSGPNPNVAPAPHAIMGGPDPSSTYSSGIAPFYHSQRPSYPPGPHYAYPAWQQFPPATPSRRRTRQEAS